MNRVDPEQPSFTLTLSKKMTYDQLAAKVAEQIQAPATHVRFTTVTAAGKPKTPVKYNPTTTLNSILFPGAYNNYGTTTQKSDALFYEVLDLSLKEMEQRKPVKVTWLPEGLLKEEEFQLMLPKTGRISDLIETLQSKANISSDVANRVRVYQAHNHKFLKELPMDFGVMSIGEYITVYAAPFPEEESEKMITVFHFDKEPNRLHGIPFRFPLREVEFHGIMA